MNDAGIIDLYCSAPSAPSRKRRMPTGRIATRWRIISCGNAEDAEESVNDTWLAAWNAMAAGAPEQSEGVSRPDHAQYFRNTPAPQRKPKARRRGSEPCDRRALRVPAGRERSGADGGKQRASPEHRCVPLVASQT